MVRAIRKIVLGFKSGMAHQAWGYSFVETMKHLRRPRPWRIEFMLNSAVPTGCLACPSIKELRKVA